MYKKAAVLAVLMVLAVAGQVEARSWFQPAFRMTEAEVERLLEGRAWPVEEAKKIAWCESSWSPNARRSDNAWEAGTGDFGLFQINYMWQVWADPPAVLWQLKKDVPPSIEAVMANIDFAEFLYVRNGGWSDWQACLPLGRRGPAQPGTWTLPTAAPVAVEGEPKQLFEKEPDWQKTTADLDVKLGRRSALMAAD